MGNLRRATRQDCVRIIITLKNHSRRSNMVLNSDAGLHAGRDWDESVPTVLDWYDCASPKRCQIFLIFFIKIEIIEN